MPALVAVLVRQLCFRHRHLSRPARYPVQLGQTETASSRSSWCYRCALVAALGAFFVNSYRSKNSEKSIESIAVLPFENRSGNPDTDYLSDGLAESLIYRLSQLPNLKVSPTSSVMRYKGSQADVAQIAKELEVDAVMSGRVSQRGDDLTISVELVDARTKKIIWAEQYDRKMSDLLATQREIATTITQKLELKLSGNDAKGITKKYTDNNEAYQLYLRGRYSFSEADQRRNAPCDRVFPTGDKTRSKICIGPCADLGNLREYAGLSLPFAERSFSSGQGRGAAGA